MKRTASKGGRAWFWLGTVLLSISALWWLIIVLIIVSEGDGATGVLVGVVTTVVPVGIGVYGVIHGRRHPVAAEENSGRPIVTAQEVSASTQSGRPATKRVSSELAFDTQGLAAYIKSATPATEGMSDGQGFETQKGDAGIESTTMSTLTVSTWDRIRFVWDTFMLPFRLFIKSATPATEGPSEKQRYEAHEDDTGVKNMTVSTLKVSTWDRMRFIWDIFVLSFPLWCPGNAAITRAGGLVEVFYGPPERNTETIDRFIRRTIWFAGRAMDRILRHEGIDRVDVWAMGKVGSEDGQRKRVWKRVRLTLEWKTWQYMLGTNSLSRLAAQNPQQYLRLCSAQWVEEAEFPVWPMSGVVGGEFIGTFFTH